VTADDLAFVVLPYDMVTVGLLLHGDLIRRGVTVFPAGKGGAYAPLPRLVNAIHDLRPTVLFTSPSYAFQIHEQYTATFPDEPHRFTRLWVAGEGASPALLRRLGRLWGADVRQRYGCTEIGPIAYTCEHGDYHQTAANCYLEVTDDAGRPVPAGEPGLITLTTLGRVGTPFVRFQPGDRGVLPKGPCACGRTMPRFRVLSRQTDMLPGERGPVAVFDVENVLFETIGNASPWYRIELSDDGATLVAEEPDGGVPDGAEQAVIDAVLSRTGLAITVRWLATGGFGRPSRKVSRVADLRTGA
jgi:phenylacetate-CoA ligase